MLRRSLLALPLALVLVAGAASAADPLCKKADPRTGTCTVTLTGPSSDPVTKPVRGTSGEETSGATNTPECTRTGVAVPCSDPSLGFWSNALEVYCRLASPQPPASDPVWKGHYGEGAVFDCTDPTGGNFATGQLWLPQAPGVTISPEKAAQAVVRRMDLRAADIGIVPEDKPGRIGAVGAPVYMWTTPGPTTFGPQVLTANAGGVTITARAKVERIVWDMGDGGRVTCRTPGTVYEDQYGFEMSPDCGYRYRQTSAGQPTDAYPVVATSYWVVDWTGPGSSSGQITLDLESRTKIVVGELQALVTT